MPPDGEDSLRKRFFFKFAGNAAGFGFNLVASAVVPRALGPGGYGDYSFLSSFFNNALGFIDAGGSTYLYTRLSQNPRDTPLLRFYGGVALSSAALLAAFMGVVYALGWQGALWPAQQARYVWLTAAATLVAWAATVSGQVVDAYGLTVEGEYARLAQRLLMVGLTLGLYAAAVLRLGSYLAVVLVTTLLLIAAFWASVRRSGRLSGLGGKLDAGRARVYARDFTGYMAPYLAYTVLAAGSVILDRWLLQKSGSVEQGYFGLAGQVGGVCALFMGSLSPIVIRDFSRDFGAGNPARVRDRFSQYGPFLYFCAAFLGVFMAFHADFLVRLFGGDVFRAGAGAMLLMSIYPVHQTYGHLTYAVFLATNRVRLYCLWVAGPLIVGVPLSFWLLLPPQAGGLGAGAAGLAAKTVALQLITVNVLLWRTARILDVPFRRLFVHQIASGAFLGTAAFFSVGAAGWMGLSGKGGILAGGILYTGLVAGGVGLFPSLVGWSRRELAGQWRWALSAAGKAFGTAGEER
jgi:O-antigen/teichoic acid export membrane protein